MPTHSPETILCAVDFSDLSAHALEEAAVLARRGGSRIIALHTNWFEAPPYFTEARVGELRDEFRRAIADARRMLDSFIDTVPGARDVEVEARVIEALPVDGIHETAASSGAALIVMGTHGRGGLNRWMLGSVAERILRESRVPVLTVREKPPGAIRNILCPVSDTAASRAALKKAAEIAAQFEATVTALHVHEPGGADSIANLCAWLPADARARCNVRELVLHGNAAEEIVRLTAEDSYDLLALGAPRRRFFEGMVLGTTTVRAVRHAACPVLSVPAGE